jgi:hypothetical protein
MTDLESLESDPLMPPAAVAAVLGVGIDCLAIWRRKRIGLPWIKFGEGDRGDVRYRPSDVRAFIEARRQLVERLPLPYSGEPTKRARKLSEALCPSPAPKEREAP